MGNLIFWPKYTRKNRKHLQPKVLVNADVGEKCHLCYYPHTDCPWPNTDLLCAYTKCPYYCEASHSPYCLYLCQNLLYMIVFVNPLPDQPSPMASEAPRGTGNMCTNWSKRWGTGLLAGLPWSLGPNPWGTSHAPPLLPQHKQTISRQESCG